MGCRRGADSLTLRSESRRLHLGQHLLADADEPVDIGGAGGIGVELTGLCACDGGIECFCETRWPGLGDRGIAHGAFVLIGPVDHDEAIAFELRLKLLHVHEACGDDGAL